MKPRLIERRMGAPLGTGASAASGGRTMSRRAVVRAAGEPFARKVTLTVTDIGPALRGSVGTSSVTLSKDSMSTALVRTDESEALRASGVSVIAPRIAVSTSITERWRTFFAGVFAAGFAGAG